MEIKTFTLVDSSKLERALNGTPTSSGSNLGGVGNGAYFEDGKWVKNGKALSDSDSEKLEDAILAEYDRIGGFIKRGDDKVKTGSFYDFKARTPRETPQVEFLFRVKGKEVTVPDGAELPGAVKAEKIAAAQEADEPAGDAPVEKKSKKSKKSSE